MYHNEHDIDLKNVRDSLEEPGPYPRTGFLSPDIDRLPDS